MDMRGKLFPVFLKEAAKNLKALQAFLQSGVSPLGSLDEIEDAFRAAHTLKETARLIQVDSVHQISRRIEVLLGRHFSAKTRLTAVEYEALELAVGWLNHLLVELLAGRPGTSTLVADALLALDLVARFPGDTPLIELLDSVVQLRPPLLNDPFADDPELLLDDEEILRIAKDPFADDPSFGFGFQILPDPVVYMSKLDQGDPFVVDTFSAEPAVDSETETAAPYQPSEADTSNRSAIPFDPFAEDFSYLETEELSLVTEDQYSPSFSTTDIQQSDPLADDTEVAGLSAEIPHPSTLLPVDLFADDIIFDEDFDD